MGPQGVANTGGVEVSLARDLGLLEVLMIGIGPNIGSTIFVLVGKGVEIAGPALLLALSLNFMVTMLTAFSYAELSSALPETGGGYLWVKKGMVAPFGFLGGWMSWVGHCIACGVYVLGFGEGMAFLLREYDVDIGLSESLLIKAFAVLCTVMFCYLNHRGVKGAGRSEIYVSIILVGIVVTYAFFALYRVFTIDDPAESFQPFLPDGDFLKVLGAMGFTFMIFEGYEIVAQTGEEAKDPERTVPRAMFLCIFISTTVFLVTAFVTIGASGWVDVGEWGTKALLFTSEETVPYLRSALIAIGIVIGSVAAVNSVIFSCSRVSFAMGRDGNLPAVFGRLHPRNQTPTMAILISGAIIIAIAVLLPIEQVASTADILILILFMLVNISALSLRKRMPDLGRHFRIPLFPYLTYLAIGLNFIIAIAVFDFEPLAWYVALVIIYAGLLIHYFAKGKEEIEAIEVKERPRLPEERLRRYRVLLPVEDARNTVLVDLACMLAAKHEGDLLLTTVIEMPAAAPLDAVDRKRVEEKRKMLERLKSHAELKGVPTRAVVRVSHDIATAIVDMAREERANIVLLGWKGYTRTQKRILGRKADYIVRQSPCDVMVLRSEGLTSFSPDRIMVLSGSLWQASKAAQAAIDIALSEGSRISFLNVIVNERYLIKGREFSQSLLHMAERAGVPAVVKETRPETLVGGVVAESMDQDLLLVGATSARTWEKFAFGPIQDKIARSARCPVLIYKRVTGTGMEGR